MHKIAIMHPGEMGSAVGRVLLDKGWEVIVSTSGRSVCTQRNSETAEFTIVPTIDEAVSRSELVLSVVPPDKAYSVAQSFIESALRTGSSPIFIDGNSISPDTARHINELISRKGINFVDGAFVGSAKMINEKTILYLSGPDAKFVSGIFDNALNVSALGLEIGLASAFKLAIFGFNKGLVALFLEMITISERIGKTDEMMKCLNIFYSSTMQIIDRLLPTYPKHINRRIKEMEEIVKWLGTINHSSSMSSGTKIVFEKFNELSLIADKAWTMREVIEKCNEMKFLNESRDK